MNAERALLIARGAARVSSSGEPTGGAENFEGAIRFGSRAERGCNA
jgi:hypothetical protein